MVQGSVKIKVRVRAYDRARASDMVNFMVGLRIRVRIDFLVRLNISVYSY